MLGSEGGENRVQNWPKTNLSTPGFCNFFSPSLSLSPPFQLPTKAATSYTTRSQHNDQLTTNQPSRLSLFSFQPFSRLCNFFFFLPQPTPATITSADASWATGRTTLSRLRPPRQATFSSLLRLVLPRRGCCMQNSFMHAAAN
jgi:hypothetical protein